MIVALGSWSARGAEEGKMLWRIGDADGKGEEFALAAGDYEHYRDDGVFFVGASESKRDWPYVQPGPDDGWAGGREHTFTIAFNLKGSASSGDCKLTIALTDTQANQPPKLLIGVNGREFSKKLPKGGGDDSIHGKLDRAKASRVEIAFPADSLKEGLNEIVITTKAGSWMLYDWLGLETPPGIALDDSPQTYLASAQTPAVLVKKGDQFVQPVKIKLVQLGPDAEATVRVGDAKPVSVTLKRGQQEFEIAAPAVEKNTKATIIIESAGKIVAQKDIELKPVRKMTIYILPHSHTDIGYTEIQTNIEKKQVNNLLQGIEYAKKTADYPDGAKFVWNVEVLWAADLYLHRLSPAERKEFFEAVKKGQVSLNGMYLNELTGLCRPEELLQLFRYSPQLADECGVTIDSAMISDVPGYTWGTVTAMAQAGIKYFSTGPNYIDRIGDIRVRWEDKPFYWMSPSGKEKVLVWLPYTGYALSHVIGKLSPEWTKSYQDYLEKIAYPYDIAYIRWSGHGDNSVPDPNICEYVKDWNAKYAWPKFVISSTSTAFKAFEDRYGDKLPQVRGDWTPYWEDGAGSSANETALNRNTSDKLTQAQTLWAMIDPAGYPAGDFAEAWKNVLLYSEHTWGAWCSVSQPEDKATVEQWALKQNYALQAEKQTGALLTRALEKIGKKPASEVEVINTTSWQRSDLVVLSPKLSAAGDRVTDKNGQPVPSQRLSTGELAFRAEDVPPFAARRYKISAGEPFVKDKATASGTKVDNGLIAVGVSEKTGNVVDLRAKGIEGNLVDSATGCEMNEYLYLIGDNVDKLQKSGTPKISVKEKGPLVASLLVESDAPGCKKLTREIRLTAGRDCVEFLNTVDKQRLAGPNYTDKKGKESVNFAFPLRVPEGELLLDVPLGAIRPNVDQMPSACKNWLCVNRWVDAANRDYGVTWITLDAPLVELGGVTANLLNSQSNPNTWRKNIEPTQLIYSWAMNNHWHTNYRAYQEGPTEFRFAVRPHGRSNPVEAAKLATGMSQPLVAVPAGNSPRGEDSLLTIENDDVITISLKPSDDGKAWIVRLFGASGKDAKTKLVWSAPGPKQVFLSDTSEKPLRKIEGAIEVPAWDIVTIRAERP
jgi:hypothetical protein